MATLQACKNKPEEGFGQKVRNIIGAVGTIKGVIDTGRTIYSAAQAAAPYLEMARTGMALL